MPRYNLTSNNEISISVDRGDILQIKSGSVEVKNSLNAADPATFVFRGHLSSLTFTDPKTILVKSQSQKAVVDVIKGL